MTINDDLTYSLKQHTAYIKINRPPNNFFDATLIESIADILDDLDKEIMCRSIILYSEGKIFALVQILVNQILLKAKTFMKTFISKL